MLVRCRFGCGNWPIAACRRRGGKTSEANWRSVQLQLPPAPSADALSVASAASKQRLAGGGCGGCDCLSAANEVGSVNDSRASERAEDERRSAFCLQTTDKRTRREFCTRRRLERTNVVINAPPSEYRRHRALQTYRTY